MIYFERLRVLKKIIEVSFEWFSADSDGGEQVTAKEIANLSELIANTLMRSFGHRCRVSFELMTEAEYKAQMDDGK